MNRILLFGFSVLLLSSCAAFQPADGGHTSTARGGGEGSQVVAFAKKYKGAKYKYGGTTPKGFDCSGYTYYVYKHFGVELPHQSGLQEKAGKRISRSEARAVIDNIDENSYWKDKYMSFRRVK